MTGKALLGRKPSLGTDEQDSDIQLVAIADPERSISKVHLLLGVDADGVWIEDQGSTNGTLVTLPDDQQILAEAGQIVRIPPGAQVTFGQVSIVPEWEQG